MDASKKPTIEYPCSWEFRVMGADARAMEAAIREVLAGAELTLTAGNTSPAGRWRSLSLRTRVESEAHRDAIHRALREHPSVRMVL